MNEPIPETQQAAALEQVAAAGERRRLLLVEAERIANEEIQPVAVEAARLGADRTRIRELAGVGPAVLYRWFEAGGIAVRQKAPAKKATAKKGRRRISDARTGEGQ